MDAVAKPMFCVVCSDFSPEKKSKEVNDLTAELFEQLLHIHLRG
jgi:hypothetical protein